MAEKKNTSLFDDDIRHDVNAVSTLWQMEQRRRRILMTKIFVPIFVVVTCAVLIITKALGVFPFRSNAEYEEYMAKVKEREEATEKIKDAGASNILGYVGAKFHIKLIAFEDRSGIPSQMNHFLYSLSDMNPSTLCIELWTVNKASEEEKALFADGVAYAVLINGQHDFTVDLGDGKTAQINTVFKADSMPDMKVFCALLNQEFRRIAESDRDIADYNAYEEEQKEAEVQRRQYEEKKAEQEAEGVESMQRKLIDKNFNIDAE